MSNTSEGELTAGLGTWLARIRLAILCGLGALYILGPVVCVTLLIIWAGWEPACVSRAVRPLLFISEHPPSTLLIILLVAPLLLVLFYDPIEAFLWRLEKIGPSGAAAAAKADATKKARRESREAETSTTSGEK